MKVRTFAPEPPDGNGKCRETVTETAEGVGRFIRERWPIGQYGHILVRIEPNVRGEGSLILNEIPDGKLPEMFIKAAEAGVREGMNNGVLAGYPVVDVFVCMLDGSFHEVDSSELAFKMAGIFAFKDAMKRARPILLDDGE
jgi:elongation factor G